MAHVSCQIVAATCADPTHDISQHNNQPRGHGQAGFTLVELLVVVVLIGILAAVAVPMFSGTSNKTRMNSETNAILTDIRTRQEQYAVEMGRYFNTADTMGVPQGSLNGTKGPWQTAGVTSWAPLKVAPSMTEVACTYFTRGGGPGTFSNIIATKPFDHIPNNAPASQNWYVVVALCDDNRNVTAPEVIYFATSWSSGITRATYVP